MSCLSLTSGICRGCRDNAGGIKTIWMANLSSVNWASKVMDTGRVKDLQLTDGDWYCFLPNKNSSSWTENINSSIENGVISYGSVLNLIFGKNTSEKSQTIKELGQSETVAVVELNNGSFFLIGERNSGLQVSGGSFSSGTAHADLNGWTVEMSVDESYPALEIAVPDDPENYTPATPSLYPLYDTLMSISGCVCQE